MAVAASAASGAAASVVLTRNMRLILLSHRLDTHQGVGADHTFGNVHRSRHSLNADTIREMHLAFRRGGRAAINKVMKQQPAVFLKLLVLLVPREMKVKHSISRMVSAFAPPKLVICHRRGHGHSFSSASSARSPKSSLCLVGCASTYLTPPIGRPSPQPACKSEMQRSTASTDRLRSQGSRRLRSRPRCYGVSGHHRWQPCNRAVSGLRYGGHPPRPSAPSGRPDCGYRRALNYHRPCLLRISW